MSHRVGAKRRPMAGSAISGSRSADINPAYRYAHAGCKASTALQAPQQIIELIKVAELDRQHAAGATLA